ncbi:DMT family transporter [Fulvimarina manganoxydans]|uniref:DMT family transporter n=1 Tax=Fulvimarina manganoxydans TaxID=937218 RepID=UPI0023538DB1|nr:DMT family transporter [Fulvimarina manganoxydans]
MRVGAYRDNLLGGIFMVGSMAAFAIEDSLIKAISNSLPTGQILIFFGLGGALLFAAMARLESQPLFSAGVTSRPMLIRVVFEIAGRLFYVLALTLIPLSTATVILQATPLLVVAGAALFFRETVGWRRWGAIIFGMIGVVLIVQPGTGGFSVLSVLAVLGMLGFAGRDLASRAAPRSLAISILGLYGFVAVVVAGALFGLWQGEPFVVPSADEVFHLFAAVVVGVAAYGFLMQAMRTGDVSAVTPFRYTRLLFGVGIGTVFFGEDLSPAMLVGSAIIVASGLFIVWRGKVAVR